LSKETTQEATKVHAKQLQYDRQIADMSLTISKLEASLREAEKVGLRDSASSESSTQDAEMSKQIKALSEEVIRLRDRVNNQNSESVAMKHRLKAAVERANKLEDDLAVAKTMANGSDGDVYDSMERAQGRSTGRRRRAGGQTGSIRSAMRLDASGGERTQQIGQVVDAVDSFTVSTGTLSFNYLFSISVSILSVLRLTGSNQLFFSPRKIFTPQSPC
jgi:chromosome segregation ATPase